MNEDFNQTLLSLIHFHFLFDSPCVISTAFFLHTFCTHQCDLDLNSKCAKVDLFQRWRQEAAAQRRQMILPDGEETIMLLLRLRVGDVGSRSSELLPWAWRVAGLGAGLGAGPRPLQKSIQTSQPLHWRQRRRRANAKRAAGER